MFAFENGGIQQYIGGYSDYFEQKQKDVVVKEKVSYSEYKKQQRENKPYLSSKDKKELESMESVIMDLEQQIADIDVKMNIISDFNEISILSNQRSELEVLLEQKNERWMELLEIEEAIKNSR